jgi:LCP family protein required for cell wall assembly
MNVKKKVTIWGIVIMLLLIAGGVFSVYLQYKKTLDDMYQNSQQNEDDLSEEEGNNGDENIDDPFVVLLYGIDSRDGGNSDRGRPDTIMLALIDPELLKVSLISIPRDSYVKIPGRTQKDKVNHSFSYGGVDLTIQTIEEWLDIPIYGYVAIDFTGFQELVDLVGGVDVYVDQRIIYDDPVDGTHIRLEQGQQVLDGKNALDFVRARLDNRGPNYYTSDYKRMERQQMVLKALGREIVSISSLPRIFSMMNVVGDNVTTTLTPKELDQLIRKFYRFNIEDLETTSIVGEALYLGGIWYEDVPGDEVQRIHDYIHRFLEREPEPVTDEEDESEEGTEDTEA